MGKQYITKSLHVGTQNHAIATKGKLKNIQYHNFGKLNGYEHSRADSVLLYGRMDIDRAVKEFYQNKFEEHKKEYNKQCILKGHSERQIREDYIDCVSKNKKMDVAAELIFQLGDEDFNGLNLISDREYQKLYREFVDYLVGNDEFKNLNIISVAYHSRDDYEKSPHLHIVCVPTREYNNGVKIRPAKGIEFSRKRLKEIWHPFVNQWIENYIAQNLPDKDIELIYQGHPEWNNYIAVHPEKAKHAYKDIENYKDWSEKTKEKSKKICEEYHYFKEEADKSKLKIARNTVKLIEQEENFEKLGKKINNKKTELSNVELETTIAKIDLDLQKKDIEKAKEKAEKIIKNAQAEASDILIAANSKASNLLSEANLELKDIEIQVKTGKYNLEEIGEEYNTVKKEKANIIDEIAYYRGEKSQNKWGKIVEGNFIPGKTLTDVKTEIREAEGKVNSLKSEYEKLAKQPPVPRYVEKELNYKTMFQKCFSAFQKLVDWIDGKFHCMNDFYGELGQDMDFLQTWKTAYPRSRVRVDPITPDGLGHSPETKHR